MSDIRIRPRLVRRKEEKMKEKRIIVRVLAAVLSIALVLAYTPATVVRADEATDGDALVSTKEIATIKNNIIINGLDVGGMTFGQAVESLGGGEDYSQAEVSLTSQYGDVVTTLGDLGLSDNTDDIVREALNYGNAGNVLKRFRDIESLKTVPVEFETKKGVDEDTLHQMIENNIASAMAAGNQYSLTKNEDGTVKVIVEGASLSIDAASTKQDIDDIINDTSYSGGQVSTEIALKDDSDSDRMQQIARVKNLLGSYTTSYASSSAGRKTNVQRATSLVNGHLVFPGETISVYSCIAPVETSNGYEIGHAYQGTEVVDSVGGGICQVATTVYNAALRAELEIVQRDCHSLRVSYVPIAADAALAGGVLDLKIRNNLDAPIYIEGLADGANLSFNIYGEEYRPSNRTIEFESIQTGVVNPPSEPIYTEDKTLEPGTEQVTAAAVTGYTGELWKYVYEDGVKVDSIKINSSKYQASAQKISINSDPAEEDNEDEDDNQEVDPANPDGTTPDGTTPDGTTPAATTPDGTTPAATTPDGTTPDANVPAATEASTEAPTEAPAPQPTE